MGDQLPTNRQYNFIIPGDWKRATANPCQKACIMKAVLKYECLLFAVNFFQIVQASYEDFR